MPPELIASGRKQQGDQLPAWVLARTHVTSSDLQVNESVS